VITDEIAAQIALEEMRRRTLRQEAETLTLSFREFIPEAWKVLKPAEQFRDNWHISAISEHLEAVTAGEIKRLQIWVPRATMKSLCVSVFWPAWEWTKDPWLRYWSASYELGLAGRLVGQSLNLIKSPWYQDRWGHLFQMLKEGERYYSNNRGGTRLATAPGSTALGEHGHRIIIDDPINFAAADATSRTVLEGTNEWYNGSVQGSKADPTISAEVIIMQRLHENDLAAHALSLFPDEWQILCLPERYERDHPFRWPDDPRSDGDLLWPEKRNAKDSDAMAHSLTSHRAAAQMQQRPSAREGEILKRHWWRFYDPKLFTNPNLADRRPKFRLCVQSVDAPLKDKQSNDLIAIQAWAATGADRYLLDLRKGNMSYSQAKRAIIEQARYVRTLSPHCAHYILIESAGYGDELALELKRELSGVTKPLSHAQEGDKILRAEAASSDLESGNLWLPGYRLGVDEYSMPDESRCAADIVDFINSCAIFPNGRHDDDVDACTQAINWIRSRPQGRSRTWSSFKTARA
jgi:predicted phage terminase large subunit-like protein